MSSRSLVRLAPPAVSLSALVQRLAAWRATRQQRRDLARLDAAALSDIGITPAQARAEAGRPVWDVTPSWRA
ncbi:MAG: hypothetical protein B7X55_10490 [Rhodobacterales bacterium 34-62-10]|nr:MAG: hypothetical protein B7X55_10490 [Rhodobacterales bacterium 34-62-10]